MYGCAALDTFGANLGALATDREQVLRRPLMVVRSLGFYLADELRLWTVGVRNHVAANLRRLAAEHGDRIAGLVDDAYVVHTVPAR